MLGEDREAADIMLALRHPGAVDRLMEVPGELAADIMGDGLAGGAGVDPLEAGPDLSDLAGPSVRSTCSAPLRMETGLPSEPPVRL